MSETKDIITMAHGSGGQASHELMSRVFGKYFHNDILDALEDAAVLDMEGGRLAYSTDSFVVTQLFFKGGNIGKLCIAGTVNDLLMMGAEPKYLTCGFIIEEGFPIEDLDRIAATMAEEAAKTGVVIAAGDTKVVDGQGGLYINTSGIGLIPAGRAVRAANMKQGDKIILSGNLGDHQACIYSARMGIDNEIASDCGVLKDITDALYAAGVTPHTMRDVTRGGLGTILNELCKTAGCGMRIEESQIPVDEKVAGLAGILGLDPLYMANEGKMIAVVAEEDAEKALAAMHATEHGRNAAVIGAVTEDTNVQLVTPLGGVRVLDVLYGEGLPRIC